MTTVRTSGLVTALLSSNTLESSSTTTSTLYNNRNSRHHHHHHPPGEGVAIVASNSSTAAAAAAAAATSTTSSTNSTGTSHSTTHSAAKKRMTNPAAAAASTVLGFVTGSNHPGSSSATTTTATATGLAAGNNNSSSNSMVLSSVHHATTTTNHHHHHHHKDHSNSVARAASAASFAGTGSGVDPQSLNNSSSSSLQYHAWSRGGRAFSSPKEVYTRSLFRLCLKFTTSEDEDEGKPEAATAFWTQYGRSTTIGNAGPASAVPDHICRRMDDSMTGPAAGIVSRIIDSDGEAAAALALAAGMTTGWQLHGERGDAAIRVGKAKIIPRGNGATNPANIIQLNHSSKTTNAMDPSSSIVSAGGVESSSSSSMLSNTHNSQHSQQQLQPQSSQSSQLLQQQQQAPPPATRDAQILSLDADRWILCKGASFCAGNSVFIVDDAVQHSTSAVSSSSHHDHHIQSQSQQLPQQHPQPKLTLQCTKGPNRGKMIDVLASKCPFVFGRAHEADLCIMDRELSRRHGAILYVYNTHTNNNHNQHQRSSTTTSAHSKRHPNSHSSSINTNMNTGKLPSSSSSTSLPPQIPPGVFILVDLESTNGTYMRLVGPYAVKGASALTLGDEFIVGRTGFSVNRFDYGISEAIGARPTMEDRTLVIQSLMLDPSHGYYLNEPKEDLQDLAMTTFAAVFDGHGGGECSNYLVNALPQHLRTAMLAERLNLRHAVEKSRALVNRGDQTEDTASELMRKIIKGAYLRADKEFITPKNSPQSGSTAATVLMFGRRLFAANVGDSRVVLCRAGGMCVELTSDHKPSRPDEAARVRAAGGFILHKRVMGELAITRAFGDKSFKMGIKAILEDETINVEGGGGVGTGGGESSAEQLKNLTTPLVSAEPEIASIILSHHDEFLLLACDGLFDVFRSQDAIALARQELIAHRGQPAEVARILSDQAIRVRRSRDNVSILIIILRPFWELT